MTARYIVGETRAVLATLEPGSVDLVLSSPPYLALRSYLPVGHPDKAAEIGSETSPGAYIDILLDVVEACARVLAPHGTMLFELGHTYAGSGGGGGDYLEGGLREGQPGFGGTAERQRDSNAAHWRQKNECREGWPLDRSLCMIPELFRISLVYGFNPLTGRQTPRWRARNVIRHFRPNPPVGALGQKWRPATSDWVAVCGGRRWFDLDAVRTKPKYPDDVRPNGSAGYRGITDGGPRAVHLPADPAGAPPLDWHAEDDLEWRDGAGIVMPTAPYPGAHYATFSPRLVARLLDCQCPARVCQVCGKPSERIVSTGASPYQGPQALAARNGERLGMGPTGSRHIGERQVETVGWSDCGHNNWRPGVVLDPFAGSGTTLQVATGHGRHAIGVDIDARNADLALERVGPLLLTVERHDGQSPPFDEDAWEQAAIDAGHPEEI